MKQLKFLFAICIITINGNCNAQAKDDQVTIMLKEFYSAYCKILVIKPVPNPNDLYTKLDSLQKTYCTQKIRKEAKEWFDDGHDLITNDWGMDIESLKEITVVKDATKENVFIVSYIVDSFPQSPQKPVKKKVTLNIGIVKEGGSYKIDSIK